MKATDLLFETADRNHNIVRLTAGQWFKHILINRDPGFNDYLEKVKECVENPDDIRKSNRKNSASRVYIQNNNSSRNFPDPFLVVIVNTQSDLVETAYTTNKIARFPK